MNLIIGEPIHITSEDLKPASEADVHKAMLDILNSHFPEYAPNEEETPSE